jgi:hypothetical protein
MNTAEPKVAVKKDMWGHCFYCHLQQDWRVALVISPLWPHQLVCPQCGSRWRNAAEFNADARETIIRVMRENPGKIANMNETEDDRAWKTFHSDAIGDRMDRQNWESLERTGKPWEPYYNDECKPQYIVNPGVDYGQDSKEADDDEQPQGAGAEAGRDTDTGEAAEN